MLDLKKCDERSGVEPRFCMALMCFDKWLSEHGCETHQQWTPPGLPPSHVRGGIAVDFAITHARNTLVIEIDGHDYHSTDEQKQRDKERAGRLEKVGCVVTRFTGSEVFQDAAMCAYVAVQQIAGRIGLVTDSDKEFCAAFADANKSYSKEAWLSSAEGKAWKDSRDKIMEDVLALLKK